MFGVLFTLVIGVLLAFRVIRPIAQKWKRRDFITGRAIVSLLAILLWSPVLISLYHESKVDTLAFGDQVALHLTAATVGFGSTFFLGLFLLVFTRSLKENLKAVKQSKSNGNKITSKTITDAAPQSASSSFAHEDEVLARVISSASTGEVEERTGAVDGKQDSRNNHSKSAFTLSSERKQQIREEEEYREKLRGNLPSGDKKQNNNHSGSSGLVGNVFMRILMFGGLAWAYLVCSEGGFDDFISQLGLGGKSVSEMTCNDLSSMSRRTTLKNILGLPIKIAQVTNLSRVQRSSTMLVCRGQATLETGVKVTLKVTASQDANGEILFNFETQ